MYLFENDFFVDNAGSAIFDLWYYTKEQEFSSNDAWLPVCRLLRVGFALGFSLEHSLSENADRIFTEVYDCGLSRDEISKLFANLKMKISEKEILEFVRIYSGLKPEMTAEAPKFINRGIDTLIFYHLSQEPKDFSDWTDELEHWHQRNIDNCGRYCGRDDLDDRLFGYKPGDHISASERYSAMLQWRWAVKVLNMKARYQ